MMRRAVAGVGGMLFVAALAGCGTTQSYLKDPDGGPRATIEFQRKSRAVGGGGDVYVFDDSEHLSPNAIIGYGKIRIGPMTDTAIAWAYLHQPGETRRLFGKDPEGSYARHDAALGASRVKEFDGDLNLIRRTTIVGTVRQGETLKWSHSPGAFRVGVLWQPFASDYAVPRMSDWLKVEAGGRYRIVWDALADGEQPAFTVEELK